MSYKNIKVLSREFYFKHMYERKGKEKKFHENFSLSFQL